MTRLSAAGALVAGVTPACWLSVAASAVVLLLGRVGAPSLRQEPRSRGAAPRPACPLGLAFWELL